MGAAISFSIGIGVLIIRLWALSFAPYFIQASTELLSKLYIPATSYPELPIFAAIGVLFPLCFIFAPRIVVWISPLDKVAGDDSDASSIVATGTLLIGLYFLLSHLPGFLAVTARAVVNVRTEPYGFLEYPFVSQALCLIIGILLTFRPAEFLRALALLRDAARN